MFIKIVKSSIGVALIAALIFAVPASAQSGNQNAQFLLELQSLRQELAELRNKVEQQGYQLRQLQKKTPSTSSSQKIGSSEFGASNAVVQNQSTVGPAFPNGQITSSGEIRSGVVSQGQFNSQSTSNIPNSNGVNFPLVPQTNDKVSLKPINSDVTQQNTQVANPSSSVGQSSVLENGNRGIQANLNELELYNKGIAKLNTQEYKPAASIFSAQLQNFPKGQKAADAYFWLAETFYILGDLDSSTKSYQSLVTLFPQHSRAPKALIKLVGVQQERGRNDMARAALNSLLRNYPNSNEASLAKAKYSALL
jgi:tol-pal system protein YbgF